LQECPKPITKITWDNAAFLSARTAIELGLAPEDRVEDANGRMIRLSVGGRTVEMPAWVVPGHAEKSISVYCGYGRRRAGRVGNGAGFDVYPLRSADGMARGVKVEALDGRYEIACTQNHQLMQGREIVRVEEIAALMKAEGRAHETPVEQNRRQLESEERGNGGKAVHLSLYPEYAYRGYRWGMVIDQTACIGCNACVVACVSENNTPVVGKAEVLRSREMHWLRIDTYFTSTSAQGEWKHQAQIPGDAKALFQPMLCQHCEKAPCEVVCPVAATSHNAEGLNEMTYNRCVGTRYCSNNCPYKVRRFNFFRYAGDEPSLAIVRNPEVSVRTRGVMEKCTYCVQRINRARTEGKIAQVNDPGNVVMRTVSGDAEALPAVTQLTACQQACPTEAIVFGDINDADAWVHRIKFGEAFDAIHYGVLEELNTQPRTTYLAVVTNSNPSLSSEKHSADAGISPEPSAACTGKMLVSRREVQA
jgi:molybdopterin-containing oxidoreductase family iron-sulfur binding subunit